MGIGGSGQMRQPRVSGPGALATVKDAVARGAAAVERGARVIVAAKQTGLRRPGPKRAAADTGPKVRLSRRALRAWWVSSPRPGDSAPGRPAGAKVQAAASFLESSTSASSLAEAAPESIDWPASATPYF